jgi:hypothetical protein
MEAWYQELVNVLMKKQDLPAVHEIFQGKKSSTQKILSTIVLILATDRFEGFIQTEQYLFYN